MLSRLAPAALAAALTCTLGGTPALANTTPKSDKSGPAAPRPAACNCLPVRLARI